jgi:hypothetical protein
MEVIEIRTLIDITNTNVRRSNQGTQEQLNQFRNWTTLMQCIGLRAIVSYDREPIADIQDLTGLGFGAKYKGKHKIWTFRFRPEQSGAFSTKSGPVGLLAQDLDKIPVIINLTETINIHCAVFDLSDKDLKNTLVMAI